MPTAKSVALRDWDRYDRAVILDITKGSCTSHVSENNERHLLRGFASLNHGMLAAVYALDKRLWLSLGAKIIDCTEQMSYVEITQPDLGSRRVTLYVSNKIMFQTEYEINGNQTDPTFDELDRESEDFWVWLSRRLQDEMWRQQIVESWERGEIH